MIIYSLYWMELRCAWVSLSLTLLSLPVPLPYPPSILLFIISKHLTYNLTGFVIKAFPILLCQSKYLHLKVQFFFKFLGDCLLLDLLLWFNYVLVCERKAITWSLTWYFYFSISLSLTCPEWLNISEPILPQFLLHWN